MTQPSLGELLDELRPFLAQMVSTAFDEFLRKLPKTTFGPGIVVSADPRTGACFVIPDDGALAEVVPAHSLVGTPSPAARVMLQFTPPAGLFIVGYLSPLRTPRSIGFVVQRSAAQTIPTGGGGTAIVWDTELQDSDNFVVGGTITVPTGLGGRYVISATGSYDTAPAEGQNASLQIWVPNIALWRAGCPEGEVLASQTAVVSLAEGALVFVQGFHTTGSDKNITAYAEMWRLGD